jgi:hypothetical protein
VQAGQGNGGPHTSMWEMCSACRTLCTFRMSVPGVALKASTRYLGFFWSRALMTVQYA